MFYDIFSKLCDEKGIRATPLLKKLKIATGSVSNWKNGSKPDTDKLIKIADYFNVSIDYLLGREKAPDKTEAEIITFDEWESRLLEHFRACDLDGKAEILTLAAQVREKREKIAQKSDKIGS